MTDKKTPFSRLAAFLFNPLTPGAYLVLCIFACTLGLGLAFSDSPSTWPKHLLMAVVWLCIARVFDTRWLRRAWVFTMSGLALVLVLDMVMPWI